MTSGTDLCELTATEARRLIRANEISPVELLEACIARIETVNPAVNALAATAFARAREEARRAESALRADLALPLLHGLPVGVKDLSDTAGVLTTYGSPLFRDYVPELDEAMVERIRAAGAVVLAKTNTPEFGAGANTRNAVWGATGNPFDTTLNAGGSSGGSAVALATGMAPLATGSDMGGSLRIPASYCGVVGFRPSPGMIATDGHLLAWSPLSVAGPMARTVADTCLLFAAQTGFDRRDPLSFPWEFPATPEAVDLGTLRCATSADLGFAPVDAAIRAVFAERVAAVASAFESCEWDEPELSDADRCFEILRAVDFVARVDDQGQSLDALGPNVRADYEQGGTLSLADVAWAHVAQTHIFRRTHQFFRDFDVLITPTTAMSPFPWEQLYADQIDGTAMRTYFQWFAVTYGITLTGHPACSLPCGRDHNGMPFGLQIVGPHRGDRFVLGVAHALEQLFAGDAALARPVPDLSRLETPNPTLTTIVTHPPRRRTP